MDKKKIEELFAMAVKVRDELQKIRTLLDDNDSSSKDLIDDIDAFLTNTRRVTHNNDDAVPSA